jgi:glycosyltransferase involved in cell wall biosynthesis
MNPIAFARRWKARLRGPITRDRITRFASRQWARLLNLDPPHALTGPVHSAAHPGYSADYAAWIGHRVTARRELYRAEPQAGLFTIVTPVYNTPPQFLRELARSVFAQDFPFEWAISDDGSTNADTLAIVDELASDPRVKCVKLPKNLGITGATRAAFELATGRYIVPVDADDLIYPDALRVMAACLEQANWPELAYSDEDKVFGDSRPIHPFFKPDWDPVLFSNCCYIAHLCAISRDAALAVNAYSDYDARGCPDLDTFVRVLATGAKPLHVPEVLYSWRIHAGSTSSAESRAKPYTIACQKHVWNKHLSASGVVDKFELRTNPLFGTVGMWYPARRRVDPGPVHVNVLVEGTASQLEQCLATVLGDIPDRRLTLSILGLLDDNHLSVAQAAERRLGTGRVTTSGMSDGYWTTLREQSATLSDDTAIITLVDGLRLRHEGWLWDVRSIFDLHADAVMVTPRVMDATGLLANAGEHFGFDGVCGPPDVGRGMQDSGYHGWTYCQRTVGVACSDMHAIRAGFVREAAKSIPDLVSRRILMPWLGKAVFAAGRRVVYTPHWLAQWGATRPGQTSQPHTDELLDFLEEHGDLEAGDRYYPRFFQLQRGRGFDLATPGERAAVLTPLLSRLEGRLEWYGVREPNAIEYACPPVAEQISVRHPVTRESNSVAVPPRLHRAA